MFQQSMKAKPPVVESKPCVGKPAEKGSGGSGGLLASLGLASGPPPRACFDLARAQQHRYELQFGNSLLRRDPHFMAAAIADDPEGALWAVHYAHPQLRRDPNWLRKARSASAAAYAGLGEAEQRAVHFEW
jgi:hypothetical protein